MVWNMTWHLITHFKIVIYVSIHFQRVPNAFPGMVGGEIHVFCNLVVHSFLILYIECKILGRVIKVDYVCNKILRDQRLGSIVATTCYITKSRSNRWLPAKWVSDQFRLSHSKEVRINYK